MKKWILPIHGACVGLTLATLIVSPSGNIYALSLILFVALVASIPAVFKREQEDS